MAATVIWRGSTALEFQVETGTLTLAERATFTDVYRGPIETCRLGLLRRGTFGSGSRLGWVVTSSKVEMEKGDIGKLTINWEAGGADASSGLLPLSEYDSQVVELYPRIERNPLFSILTLDNITHCYGAAYGSAKIQRDNELRAITGLLDTDEQKAPALKLIDKFKKGQESWYVAGCRLMLIWYSFTAPTLSLGGFTEVPSLAITFGVGGMSWLRLSDFVQSAGVAGSAFKVTSTWLGGPLGYWDPELYP